MLSVIIPAYNVEPTIELCFRSIDQAIDMPCEIIVVNDCSQDRTREITENYKSSHHLIKTVNLSQNSGPAIARAKGLEIATREFILFVDADDKLVPHCIDSALSVMKKENVEVGLFPYKIQDVVTGGGARYVARGSKSILYLW